MKALFDKKNQNKVVISINWRTFVSRTTIFIVVSFGFYSFSMV